MRRPSLRNVLPPLAAALVVTAGAAVLWAGLSRTALLGGDAPVTGRLDTVGRPVAVTAPGMSELSGGQFTVSATATGDRPVFIGVGRAADVEAYLGAARRDEITALETDGSVRVAGRDGEASVPDPAGDDEWAVAAQGRGSATLTWPRAPGSWRVVVASDGRTPPSSVRFTWAGSAGSSGAPALIAVGAVLLVAGLAGLLAIRSGRVLRGTRFAAPAPARAPTPTPPTGTPSTGTPATGTPSARRRAAASSSRPGPAPAPPATPATGLIPVEGPRQAAAVVRGERRARLEQERAAGATGAIPVAPVRPDPPAEVDLRGPARRDVDLRDHRDQRTAPPDDTENGDDDAGDETVLIQPFRRRRPGRGDRS